MNYWGFIASVVATGTVLAAGAAQAQGPGKMHRFDLSFQALDTDADGQITREEMQNHRIARFAETDADGDELLSYEEMVQAGNARVEVRVTEMIERFDTNGDGALSLEEMPERGKSRRSGKMFDRIDADDSGSISQEEVEEAKARMKEHKSRRHGKN